jgi:MFS family permease
MSLRGPARVALWASLIGGLVGSIPALVLSAALPQLAVDLDASEVLLSWAITAPLLASAVAMPVLGKLGDLYGHRRVFLIGLLIATVTSLVTPFAWDAWSFIALRVVTQVAGFAIQPSGVALLIAAVPREKLGGAFGALAFVSAAGPAIGLVVGGLLLGVAGWWAIFAMQGAIGLIALVLTFFTPDYGKRRPQASFDVPGATTLGLACFGAILALSQVVDAGWGSLTVQLGLLAAIVGGVGFWLVERNKADPFLPRMLAHDRPFTTAVLAQFSTQAATFGIVAATPLFLQATLGYTASTASLLMLAMPVPFAIVGPYGGRMAVNRGQRLPSILGTAIMVAGMLAAAAGGLQGSAPLVIGGVALLGVGHGFCRPGYALAVARAGGEHHVGIATATERMFNQIGSATGIAVLLAIAPTGSASSYAIAMLVGAGFTVVSLVIAVAFIDH